MTEVTIRPMRPEDVADAERLSAESFLDLDRRMQRRAWPEPQRRSPARQEAWTVRTRHFLETDPGGCWVADDAGGMIGMATSFVRDKTWFLATYAVRPDVQSRGVGRQLLEAALHHGRGCLRGMLSAGSDPRSARRYRLAGFTLHPQMFLTGTVDRSVIPVVEKVREGSAADTDLMDSVDRQVRDAAHGPDHALMQRLWRPIVSDSTTGSGYAYLDDRGTLQLLAATNRATATRLLWAAVADGPEGQTISHVTAANEWAVDVGMAARLELHSEGYLALRGMSPPSPYVHSGALL
ncbi:GNAT family N-acetyltransferase [Nocardioides sp. 503]|uniref:GNAT family N-acetyltransferase n=1 Tax=Nocardioides sp. 503 TaxID=2508326 RepID=UPI0010703DE5|nr:GNAT family N-acetyltransferase [Nocardioides sp. 503]